MATIPDPRNIQRRTPRASTAIPTINYQPVDDALAGALQDVGNDAYKYALTEKARIDSIIVDDAKNQYLQKALELEDEYSQIQGKNAVTEDIVKTYTDKLQGFSDSLSSKFKNQTQKDAWNKFYGADKVRFTAGVMKHKLAESDSFATETYKATNATRINNAHTNWSDDSIVNQSASDIVTNIAKEKVRSGWDEARTELELQQNLGPLWAGVATQYLNAKQYKQARKLLEQHQGVIGVDNYTTLNKAIDNGEKIDLSQQKFNEIIATIPNEYEQRKAARAIGGEIGDATLNRVKEYQTEQRVQENADYQDKLRIKKQIVDQNENDAWLSYSKGTLTQDDLDKRLSTQEISLPEYKALRTALTGGEKFNDPIIVGDIATDIELRNFDNAKDALQKALVEGKIKTETYISMKKSMASKAYSDGISYINKAMQPLEFNLDFNLKQKHADAINDFSIRVANDEDPIEVAKEIVKQSKNKSFISISNYRRPRFLTGDMSDIVNLNTAEAETLNAYNNKRISPDEYKREMELIDNIKKSIDEMKKLENTEVDLGRVKR